MENFDEMSLGDAALCYAELGYPVFPLRPRDKRPITEHGVKDASSDPKEIRAWWQRWPDANIGLACDGLIVVDIDPRNGGPADRSDFIEQFGPIPETAEAITGGGGRHILFRYAGGPVPKQLAEGIDLKAGEGAYIVVAPSIHPTGGRYSWDQA